MFTTGLFLDHGRQIVDLLASGVLARHPELQFVSTESGIVLIRFIMQAWEDADRNGQIRQARSSLTLPSCESFAREVDDC